MAHQHWYLIGVAMGFGLALGVFVTALFSKVESLLGFVAAAVIAAAATAGIAFAVENWQEAVGAAVGGVVGVVATVGLAQGTLKRGGTYVGVVVFFGLAALVIAVFSLIPVVGYVLTAVLPLLGLRARRRSDGRYAGLRILAKD